MEPPPFFVPGATPGKQEAVYAQLASMCDCKVPDPNQRVYSINFCHDGVRWTATVGETLHRTTGKVVDGQEVTQGARVRAIFPSRLYFVVTDRGEEMQLMSGQPTAIIYFGRSLDPLPHRAAPIKGRRNQSGHSQTP